MKASEGFYHSCRPAESIGMASAYQLILYINAEIFPKPVFPAAAKRFETDENSAWISKLPGSLTSRLDEERNQLILTLSAGIIIVPKAVISIAAKRFDADEISA